MRFLTADYLYPLCIAPIKEGVLQISNQGEVQAIFKNREDVPKEKLEIFNGILCPGFINAHCHLELSHLQGIIPKSKGFLYFVSKIQQRNEFINEEIQNSIANAEAQMINNGIVGVGDICNTNDTIFQKRKQNLQYYNFIEIFEVRTGNLQKSFNKALSIRNQFRALEQQATITPHAPYSVLPIMMQEIANIFENKDKLYSIHMQETSAENELFQNKSGIFLDWLNKIGADSTIWNSRNKSTDILDELNNKKSLLVHNTFSKQEDMTDNYYCTCPKANLYIENSLPDYTILNPNKLCVGTDSLASNNSLSIIKELLIIQENSEFHLNELLKIGSKNGAQILGFSNLGTFDKGKKPGIVLIQKLNNNKLSEKTTVKKLQ